MRDERVRAPIQPARGQLWMLQGGPGASSLQLAAYAPLVATLVDVSGLVIYFTYSRHHSLLGKELRGELPPPAHGVSS